MGKPGRPKKNEENKKVKYGISIDRYLFDKMKKEKVFQIQNLKMIILNIMKVMKMF